MRLLILGGTWFLGRTLAEQALERDHNVVTFTRGKSGSDVPGAAPHRGDRASDRDMAELAAAGPWDVVIDTSGMTPDLVQRSTQALADATGRYVYVSTVNVYTGWPTDPLDDDSPVRPYTPYGPPGESGADQYGREKSGCEQAVTTVFGDRATILRPSVIFGPYEYVGRIPWWLRRIAKGGLVLAPGTSDRPIQPIDVRDVAAFALHAAEQQLGGSFNLSAPIGSATFGELLEACRQVTGIPAVLEWVPHDFLIAQGVREWTELPLWRPYPGTWRVNAARARAAGLTCRPLADTVADTWRWLNEAGPRLDHERASELGITPEREAAILAAWAAHRVG
ncbi:NAD-dependent epimerase/dehydratase family protein [Nonomuraea sp. B19D2]|uniref:NAD-dependent epimerase/dehydratase family protein n=1 Tax=Nonomuraea sp. B19D2 TaxID=3159561 RepID=UPI0032DB1392